METRKVVLFINTCDFGSTGSLVQQLIKGADTTRYKVFFATSLIRTDKKECFFNVNHSTIQYQLDRFLCKIDGSDGFRSIKTTKTLCDWIRSIRPDVENIHNVHGHYLNLPLLLRTLEEIGSKIVFTMHDCWYFTGKCPHFEPFACEKWKTGCQGICPDWKNDPRALLCHRVGGLFKKKKDALLKLNPEKTIFISPSKWLDRYFGDSFLKNYPHLVINNGVDETVFHPEENKVQNKKILLLGVASPWSSRKGLDDFNRLAADLDPNVFEIMLAGLTKKDKTNSRILRLGHLSKTQMADFYRKADAFVNASVYDNYPTVVLEAIATGTAVISYKTGGSCEPLTDQTGICVEKGNYPLLKRAVESLPKQHFSFTSNDYKNVDILRTVEQYYSVFSKLSSKNDEK